MTSKPRRRGGPWATRSEQMSGWPTNQEFGLYIGLACQHCQETYQPAAVRLTSMRHMVISLLVFVLSPLVCGAQAPVFVVTPLNSWIRFNVKASVAIAGKFDKWDASLTFTSPEETTGTLMIKIQADSVDTGSGMKNGKLKGKDFFDVENYPEITFVSSRIVPTGIDTYEVDGNFTIRGVSNPEKLKLTVSGKGTGSGVITGRMVFNRRDYGMNKGIPFIKIADHVDVSWHLTGKRVSGPPLATGQ